MFNSIILNIKQQRYNRYSQAFNFFQSKSINMIIGSRKMDYVIHYRDLQYLDDETQYFKRYYATNQTSTRIKKLINYYEINMTPPNPNLLTIHNYHILETRNRKLLKLCIMKEKSEQRRSIVHQELQEDSQGQMILSQLNNSNYSEVSSDKSEESENQSYDSEPYNTYQTLQNEGKEKNKSSIEYFNLRSNCDYLIWEFKPQEQAPKINIIPPAPLPLEKITNTVAVQTLPIEIMPPQKKVERQKQQKKQKQMKQKSRQKSKQKSKPFIPQLKKEMPSSPQALGIKSEIKTENVILTESIEMIRPIKQSNKKPTSFMEYYNSVPVKKPSNILEKFIKRKK